MCLCSAGVVSGKEVDNCRLSVVEPQVGNCHWQDLPQVSFLS